MSIFNPNSLNSETVSPNYQSDKYTPVLALKELVASLQREQNKIQNLLSSLSFALRSFNNLNQFLELTPLMVARVTDAEGGALILYHDHHKVKLEQIYCQNNQFREQINQSFQNVILDINNYQKKQQKNPDKFPNIECFSSFVEDKFHEKLAPFFKVFSTPILIKNIEKHTLGI